VNDAIATKLRERDEEREKRVAVMAEALEVYFPSLYYYSLLEYQGDVQPGTGSGPRKLKKAAVSKGNQFSPSPIPHASHSYHPSPMS
jgi:hypothetical protein